jgi:cytosine/adenosine deaminase-related metal-dependent hydrolase
MKRFSAQYIITNSTPVIKRGIINIEDDGTIIDIEDTSGDLTEKHSVEFHNGIIVPGFVNCHCHLELSHMKGKIPQGLGLGDFVEKIRSSRTDTVENIIKSAYSADNDMYSKGVSLCADICNTPETFHLKKQSSISYINLLEVFGIDPDRATKRIEELKGLADKASEMNLPFSLVPHSSYSMSLTLLRLLKELSTQNKVTSIHFMETSGEKEFLENQSGPLMISYRRSGLIPARLENVRSHSDAVLKEVTPAGNLILVHNTFADKDTIRAILKRGKTYWCLCPNSNVYIEKTIPPVSLLIEEGCEIVIGTDSMASNASLSILDELITLQLSFPALTMETLISWATVNGARALGEEEKFGKIAPGTKPGLLLLQNVDLLNMKLLPDSFVTRLV